MAWYFALGLIGLLLLLVVVVIVCAVVVVIVIGVVVVVYLQLAGRAPTVLGGAKTSCNLLHVAKVVNFSYPLIQSPSNSLCMVSALMQQHLRNQVEHSPPTN
ncbi:hypothetical protein Tco_1485375 [Tanacetum coccineum]